MKKPRSLPIRWIGLVAASLAVAVVLVVIAPRVLNRSVAILPGATPIPAASPRTSDFDCTLPVIAGNNLTGFVNSATGAYRPASKVSIAGLPGFGAPMAYDPAVRRWLPVPSHQVSPDGLAYVYVKFRPGTLGGGQVRRYDLLTGADVELWDGGQAAAPYWSNTGIYILQRANFSTQFHIDPATDKVTQLPIPFKLLPGDPPWIGSTAADNIGLTADGQWIWWYFNLQMPGAVDWVFYETSPGMRVYIYKGTDGDATGFYPETALADTFGTWFSDNGNTQFVWHWDERTGLRRVNVTGLPHVLDVVPAGPCF